MSSQIASRNIVWQRDHIEIQFDRYDFGIVVNGKLNNVSLKIVSNPYQTYIIHIARYAFFCSFAPGMQRILMQIERRINGIVIKIFLEFTQFSHFGCGNLISESFV